MRRREHCRRLLVCEFPSVQTRPPARPSLRSRPSAAPYGFNAIRVWTGGVVYHKRQHVVPPRRKGRPLVRVIATDLRCACDVRLSLESQT
jgi:hypothetical protein